MAIKFKFFLVVFVLFGLLSSCDVYNVIYTDQNQNFDFTKYKTFAWLPDEKLENSPYQNAILEENTKNYFTHEFLARGMSVHTDSPDVLLQLVIKADKKQRTEQVLNPTPTYYYSYPALSPQNPYYNPFPGQYYYNRPYYSYPNYTYSTRVVDYTESTITLNMIDRVTNTLVWTVVSEGDLYSPSEMQNSIHSAVKNMLFKYPIKPIKIQK